jgi:ribosome-binding factor A
MPSYRKERIAELVHKELATRLRQDHREPVAANISITSVSVTRDLKRADIRYLPLGGDAPSDELVEALDRESRRLRGPIGRALRLRHAPELKFHHDSHALDAFRVSDLLDRLAHERGEDEE